MLGQGVCDPAICDLSAATLMKHAPELASERLQLSDLRFDSIEMLAGDGVHLLAVLIGSV